MRSKIEANEYKDYILGFIFYKYISDFQVQFAKSNDDNVKYFAQELKGNTYNLTRMNLVMRGIKPSNIQTRNGDTLEDDWPFFEDNDPVNTYNPLYLDAVVSNPPYSQKWDPEHKENDARFSRFGLAPKSKADYAFLLHDLYHLKPDGIMAIVLPHGVLFRGGEEGEIRKQLIENDHLDTIIGLPPNIFFGTGIPTIILVLKQKRKNNDVLIVDAAKGFAKEGKNNKLPALSREDQGRLARYQRDEHRNAVVRDISDNWVNLSQGSKFHAIFATSSISEAIIYYRLMKSQCPNLKTTALFDPNIDPDSNSDPAFKTEGLVELLTDYNERYDHSFDLGSHGKFKKNVAARLAHKKPYNRIEAEPDKQIDLLIVVDQMLTGFDSKWVNTLYLDKVLKYESIIQAFSRTNRLFHPLEKPFGTIRYYRQPHTMERNIEAAVKLYSGDKPIGLFADRLPGNVDRLNACFVEICAIYDAAGIEDFKKLPDDLAERAAFAKQFHQFSSILEAAKIQGFTWEQTEYKSENGAATVTLAVTREQYVTLLQRYKELGISASTGGDTIPFDIDSHITEIDTGKIDADYMNSRFEKFLKVREGEEAAKEKTLAELHRSFASLPQEEQKFAEIFLRDIHRGDVQIDPTRTFRDHLNDYQAKAKDEELQALKRALGIDVKLLAALTQANVTAANLDEFGRFTELKDTIDKRKAKAYLESATGETLPDFKVNVRAANLLRKFILEGGFELEHAEGSQL